MEAFRDSTDHNQRGFVGRPKTGWSLFLAATLFVIVIAGFIQWTFPAPQAGKRSTLTVEVLPVSEWGIGYYCLDSPDWPEAGYFYGFILVKRTYHFGPC